MQARAKVVLLAICLIGLSGINLGVTPCAALAHLLLLRIAQETSVLIKSWFD
jgi:hypothetical protein